MKITYALWFLPIRGETVLEQAVNSYNQHFNPLSPYRLRPHSYNGYVGVFT